MIMKPTAQYDDRGASGYTMRDYAQAGDMSTGSFSSYALERLLRDCSEQPNWRMRAKVCAAYYDGKQLTELKKWHIRAEDLEERCINLIRPVINSVLGQEAKSRTDVKVEPDDDSYSDVAAVISGKLKEAERETCAHMAVSEAYASMVKKGLGWVHVSKNSDPLMYPYRFESVPIDEIWWDWRGQRGPTLQHYCRWLVRSRFVDLDELQAAMPKFARILESCASGWNNYLDNEGQMLGQPDGMELTSAYDHESRFNLVVNKQDWLDSARKMIRMYEVWYRVPAHVIMLQLTPLKKVIYDQKNKRHVELVANGGARLTKELTSQVRRALYAGPYRLLDEGTDKKNFPYIPFFAFRDDDNKSPYGLIDGMIAPQDDFNDRHHRIQWMLKARQIQMDSDAVDTSYNTLQDIADGIMRPDLAVITNKDRTNKEGPAIRISNDLAMDPEQFKVQAEAKQHIQDTAGRYASSLGSAQVQSGIANSMLIEQGEQSMGEMNDNYTYSRRAAFECLVDEISSDYEGKEMDIAIGNGSTKRMVHINGWDPATNQPINQIKDADIVTALAETPNTPAFRQQQQKELAGIITALSSNPQATAVLAPAYIEATSMPDRKEVANTLRKVAGLPVPGDKEGEAAAEAQQKANVQAEQQQKQQLGAAQIDVHVSTAERNRASARASNAQAMAAEAQLQAGKPAAEVAETMARTNKLNAEASNEDQMIDDALNAAREAVA